MKNALIIGLLLLIVALPFLFRRSTEIREWKEGDPFIVIITPMNEAIRHEYGIAFARWHLQKYGVPAKIDWRNIGGGTEIMRYLTSEFTSSFRAWWIAEGNRWRSDGESIILNRSFNPDNRPADVSAEDWAERVAMFRAFRETDDPACFTSRLDMFFGGGAYDANNATRQGLLVPPWAESEIPPGLLADAAGNELIPTGMSGEEWHAPTFYGTTLSTFGICYNRDRMLALGITQPPQHWRDLANPQWAGTLGVADPTKSGSIAKAFETIVQVECHRAVEAAGFGPQVEAYEAAISAARLPPGGLPPGVPQAYQEAIERGWQEGLRIVQQIGANARYFTDSASKIPLDVGSGNAAAGLVIDFYGRFEAQVANAGKAEGHMAYITPRGGSGVSADPISILRGAPHKETARRFIEFLLSEEGQAIWCYRTGTPGGPETYALQRFPIRRDFYPSPANPAFHARYEHHRQYTTDDLGDPSLNAYALAAEYVYHARWTAPFYGVFRDLIRAMCMDAGIELKQAWAAIQAAGGPTACPAAMDALQQLPQEPEPFTWADGQTISRRHDRQDLLQQWTRHFRRQYQLAATLAAARE